MDKDQATPTYSLSRKQIFWTMAGVMLAMLLSALDQTIVGTAMPRIIVDLGGFNQYAWVTSIYLITSAVTMPISGKLSDMYGRKVIYIIGISVFILASIACGFSQNITQLIIFRGLQGIGGGVMLTNAFTVVGDLFPASERGKYQGLIGSVWAFASIIGPTVGGFLTDNISWHWVFFVNVPLGLIAIIVFLKFFPHTQGDNLKHSIDYPGLIVLILTIAPIMIALSWGGSTYSWSSPLILSMLVIAVLMLGLFIFLESRAREPIIPLSLFKNRIVSITCLLSFLTSIGLFCITTFVPLYYQGILGFSATKSGNLLMPMAVASMFASVAAGQWLSRRGGHYRILGIVGTACICLGMFILTRLTVNSSYWMVIIALSLTGLCLGGTMVAFTIAVQNAVPYKMLGVVTSSNTFIRTFGGAVGLAVLGSIMTNRFLTGFISQIPDEIKKSVPMDEITSLAHNPQALVNPSAQEQLKTLLTQPGTGTTVFDQVMNILRQTLSSAITDTFIVAFVILLFGLVVSFFMKEIPLKKDNRDS